MLSRASVPPLDLAAPRPWRRFIPEWLRSLIWIDSAGKYDAFLSYSWKSDSKIAPVIQSAIQRFLCPWYKLRAKTVFRDLSCLPAGSSLKGELCERLDRSTHLIVLASPEAAASNGMEMEARYWFSRPRDGEVLIIISSGSHKEWEWKEIREHLVPPAVRDNLQSAPVWASIQDRRNRIIANPTDHQLREEVIEDLKQVLLRFYPDRDWGQLRGEERSQRRRAIWLLSGVSLLLLVLSVAAFHETLNARHETRIAVSRQLASQALEELWRDPQTSAKDAIDSLTRSETKEARNALDQAFAQSRVIRVLPHDAPLSGAAFSGDENFVISSTYSGAVWLWDPATRKVLQKFPSDSFLRISGSSLSPYRAGKPYILTSFRDNKVFEVVISEVKTGKAQCSFIVNKEAAPITSAVFSPSGKYIATTGWDSSASIWDTDKILQACLSRTISQPVEIEPIKKTTKLHGDIINSIRFGSDEQYVVTASQDGRAKIWNWKSNQKVELRRKSTALFSAEFGPENVHTVLTACQDSICALWEWNDPCARAQNCQHKDRSFSYVDVRQATFNASGEWVVTSSSDGKAFVWNSKDPQNFYELEGHRGAITGSAFSHDGRFIVTASMDGTARIWIAKPVPVKESDREKIQYLKSLPDPFDRGQR
jgi:WD40 repeat protein